MKKVVIKKCQVGYDVYEVPYFFLGEKYSGLLFTASTKNLCEDFIKKNDYVKDEK